MSQRFAPTTALAKASATTRLAVASAIPIALAMTAPCVRAPDMWRVSQQCLTFGGVRVRARVRSFSLLLCDV